jgi:hypothetical protein
MMPRSRKFGQLFPKRRDGAGIFAHQASFYFVLLNRYGAGIFVRVDEERPDVLKALISG